MSQSAVCAQPLLDSLPPVRGRYTANASLDKITWFRAGGCAAVLYKPADLQDLSDFLRQTPHHIPLTVLGVGSNLLVRDGGIPGVVIRLGRELATIHQQDHQIIAGAGALDIHVASVAADAHLAGLEFLSGIPGTIGGALRMNAGAYGREITNVFVQATALDRQGNVHTLSAGDMGFAYRRSAVPHDWIFVQAVLAGTPGNPEDIHNEMQRIRQSREESQPIRSATGGSTFKNPPGHKAWELIDQAGCRGLRRGDAMMSEKHCNFMINCGQATATDLEDLGEEVRRRVLADSGIQLEWEIKIIGQRGVPCHVN